MITPKEIPDIHIYDLLIGTIGAYLGAQTQGNVTARDLTQETLDKLDTISNEVFGLLMNNLDEDLYPHRPTG